MARVQEHEAREASENAARTASTADSLLPGEPDLFASPPMRYQSEYVWLIFFSSLDIMLTWVILRRGGEEVNPMARLVIEWWGLNGAIAFKFALMLFVIVSCEIAGRKRDHAGRWLARVAVGISGTPVIYSLALLVNHIVLHPVAT